MRPCGAHGDFALRFIDAVDALPPLLERTPAKEKHL
jgi:hypothetical protein